MNFRSNPNLALPLDDGASPPVGGLKVVAFDFDGVVVDSREANVQFYSHMMEAVEREPVRPEETAYIHMHPARDSLAFLLRETPDRLRAALDYLNQVDYRRFSPYLKPEPGLRRFLSALRPDRRIALATNRTVSTPDVLEYLQLTGFFDLVATAADVQHAKPSPELMGLILDRFLVEPVEVLYVGDSSVDEEFAAASGVWFAAFKNPELRAHFHVECFRDLQRLFFPESD